MENTYHAYYKSVWNQTFFANYGFEENETDETNQQEQDSSTAADNICSKLQKSLSITKPKDKSESEKIQMPKRKRQLRTANYLPFSNPENHISFREISSHIIQWGNTIVLHQNDSTNSAQFRIFNNLKVVNTCTIDYFLFALWFSYKS